MNELVTIMKNQALTTSLKVAKYFGKRHDHVVRDIEKLMSQMATESQTPILGNAEMFYKSNYKTLSFILHVVSHHANKHCM